MHAGKAGRQVADGTAVGAAPGSRAGVIASRGVRTTADLAGLASATIADLFAGAVTPRLANAAGGQARLLIRTAEFQAKNALNGEPVVLIPGEQSAETVPDAREYRRRELIAELAALEGHARAEAVA